MDIAEIYVKSKIDLPPASRHFCQLFLTFMDVAENVKVPLKARRRLVNLWPLWALPEFKYVNSLFSTTEQWARMNLLLCFTQNKNIFIEIQMLRDITVLKTFTGWNMNLVLTKRELRPVDNEFADEMAVFWRRLDILKNLAILTSRKRILFF